MTFASREFLSEITYWEPTGTDGAGGFTYKDPVVIMGRYEEVNMRVNASGVEVESEGSACVDTDVLVSGLILQGDHVTGKTPSYIALAKKRARMIVKFMKVSSIVEDGTYDRTCYV